MKTGIAICTTVYDRMSQVYQAATLVTNRQAVICLQGSSSR